MTQNTGHSAPILPGGTVTFLFTDIEGSTQLLDQLRDQYAALLAAHHEIIRAALEQWHGREVDTQGDAFFAAFPKATEAVAAVAQIQRALAEHPWPEEATVRVRMGLHTGEPWLVEEGYVGMDVHRAARIGHVGYGGQVLLSGTTTALVQDDLPEGVTLLDLGRHRLKDMRRPEPIQQLVIEGLTSEFPPLKSLETLPDVQITSPADGKAGVPRQVGDSPYRGLAAFKESDAELFFGREAFTNQLVLAVGEQQLVAVIIGPSGSGKSSAVFAGLLPQLREEGNWLFVEMRPGARPFQALAAAVIPTLEYELSKTDRLIETQKLAQAMRDGELSLFQVAELALDQYADADRLLLVIDQFEEVFTLRPDPEDQQLFLDELLASAQVGASLRRSPLVLLLTLRADFMGQALGHRPFTDALQEGALILGPMNREELQAAVEKPAEQQGAAFEPGLVQRILDDIGEEPGNLPLLEFALTLLWERLEDGWMTHAAYDEIGRVDGALARYADEVWEELDEAEREGARPLFIQLVQPGEGTEDTRRVARRSELAPGHWALVQHLADRRLVVTGQDDAGDETVEVVHEALIRGWERLKSWMMADRTFRTWQEGLRVAQRGWESSGGDEGSLLRAAPLALALEWAEEHPTQLSAAEVEFVEASRQASEKRAAEEAARRQRELETAQKLAETEHARAEEQERAASGLRRRAYFLTGVLVIAAVLAIAAIFFAQQSNENASVAEQNAAIAATSEAAALAEADQRATAQAQAEIESQRADAERDSAISAQVTAVAEGVRADEQRDAALAAEVEADEARAEAVRERDIAEQQTRLTTSRELALAAINNLENDPELSILLALEALSAAHTQEAEEALHWSIPAARTKLVLGPHDDIVVGIDVSPDGQRVVTSSFDGTAKVWDAVTGEELLTFEGHTGEIFDTAFSPDGKLVATASQKDNTVRVWDIDSGEERLQINGHEGPIPGVAFHPDGFLIASSGDDGFVKLWNLESGEETLSIEAHSDRILDIQFSHDGSRLISGGYDGTAKIWDAVTGQELIALTGHDNVLESTAFSPDGSLVATASHDYTARVWDAASGEELLILPGHTNEVWGVAFSPDGDFLATASADGTAKLWSLDIGREVFSLNGHDAQVKRVVFSPDGTRLVTSSLDNTARIWDVTPGHELLSFRHDGATDVEYSPDGSRIAAPSFFGPSWIWDAESGELLHTLEGHTEWGTTLKFSPAGDLIATGNDDTTAKIWDVETGQELMTLSGHEDWVNEVAFSPNGNYLATAGNEGVVYVWELSSGLPVTTINVQTEGYYGGEYVQGEGSTVWAVDFSPDGARLAIGVNKTVEIWDVDGGQRLSILDQPGDHVRTVIYNPDGTRLATSSWDGNVIIWDLENNEELLHINASNNLIKGMAFSSDWRKLATTSSDATVKYWDATTGERLLTLKGHTEELEGLAISTDGNRLVSASRDYTMRVWTLPLDELIAVGEARVTRTLTTEECRQYLHMDACPDE